MESPATAAALLLLLLSTVATFATAAPGTTICNMTKEGLLACKPAATPPNPPPPSAACCQALAGADLPCLCTYKNSPELPGLGIDPALAMQLPGKCNLAAPTEC